MDINDRLPRIPNMKWGALLNYIPSKAEINELINNSPFPEDGRWHSILKDSSDKSNNEKIIDGYVVREQCDPDRYT